MQNGSNGNSNAGPSFKFLCTRNRFWLFSANIFEVSGCRWIHLLVSVRDWTSRFCTDSHKRVSSRATSQKIVCRTTQHHTHQARMLQQVPHSIEQFKREVLKKPIRINQCSRTSRVELVIDEIMQNAASVVSERTDEW